MLCRPSTPSLAILITVVSLHGLVRSELVVTPFEQSAETGTDAKFICEASNKTDSVFIKWSYDLNNENNDSIEIPTTGRIRAVNGTLTLTNVTYEDARTYRCNDDIGSEPQTGVLIVYDMPDYLDEGLIIAGICAFLLIIVLIGAGLTLRNQITSKKKRMINKRNRLEKMTKSAVKYESV